ncbi:hypothetical protein EOD39_5099 [Acipenser ruthenus]|uniref:Uncharacterized protein n=1 Tax=Acipenser ruthenus TaxID=7906 RepID=A0A444UFH8_ACIRT|nr:hypothetical protein EOD39_5099 [Acipenser ruthenus]
MAHSTHRSHGDLNDYSSLDSECSRIDWDLNRAQWREDKPQPHQPSDADLQDVNTGPAPNEGSEGLREARGHRERATVPTREIHTESQALTWGATASQPQPGGFHGPPWVKMGKFDSTGSWEAFYCMFEAIGEANGWTGPFAAMGGETCNCVLALPPHERTDTVALAAVLEQRYGLPWSSTTSDPTCTGGTSPSDHASLQW